MEDGDVTRWLADYGAAWAQRDGRAAAALFTDDGIYDWGPFSRLTGRDAIAARWDEATSDIRSARFTSELIGSDGDRRFVRWRTILDDQIELDGVFVLDFAPEGGCRHLQEWWLTREHAAGRDS
jgi:limonene-1,2-epoxide hydrolase